MMIDTDALLATYDAHDDEYPDLNRFELILLIAEHLTEINAETDADALLLSYDICPTHRCDIEICLDDNADCITD